MQGEKKKERKLIEEMNKNIRKKGKKTYEEMKEIR